MLVAQNSLEPVWCAAVLGRFTRGRKRFSETKVPQATDDDDAAPEQIVVTPHGA